MKVKKNLSLNSSFLDVQSSTTRFKHFGIEIIGIAVLLVIGITSLVFAQTPNNPNVGTQLQTVCCEETKSGAFCQNVPSTECNSDSRQVPTNCESTSYCRAGTCYDSSEGTCLDSTPQLVCNNNGGVWSQESPPQCSLGCCVLGDQAAFVSLVRCKRLSSFLGLEANYDKSVTNEDTCGNPANIYDASKANEPLYWSDVKSSGESCNPSVSNALSSSCGNCDYLQGSICRGKKQAGGNPTYGDFICANLNCKNTQNGEDYKHGESWCVYNDAGGFGKSDNTVGSRFYKHICINGEETLEQCEDFRAEECISDTVNDFSQAACKVNRWQDCLNQNTKLDCDNQDVRDCVWKEGVFLSSSQKVNVTTGEEITGTCFAENSPGFNFWSDTETTNLCALASETCVVKFEKGLFDKSDKAVGGNKECWDDETKKVSEGWIRKKVAVCENLGDCGPSTNWIGQQGYNKGYKITIGEPEKKE